MVVKDGQDHFTRYQRELCEIQEFIVVYHSFKIQTIVGLDFYQPQTFNIKNSRTLARYFTFRIEMSTIEIMTTQAVECN